MLSRVLRFVRLPFVLVLIYAIARFSVGVFGVPYAPRGNAMFSIVAAMMISSFYFGALSGKVGGFGWGGTLLIGVSIGFFAELVVLLATLVSYLGNLNTYFIHWDALNIPEGTTIPLGTAMGKRAGGLIAGPILCLVAASLGRALSGLAPGERKN
jgi:hypothetical protein